MSFELHIADAVRHHRHARVWAALLVVLAAVIVLGLLGGGMWPPDDAQLPPAAGTDTPAG